MSKVNNKYINPKWKQEDRLLKELFLLSIYKDIKPKKPNKTK